MSTFDRMHADFAERERADAAAKTAGTLVGRTVKFPAADSYAYYVVSKATKATVTLVHAPLGDGWKADAVEMVNGKFPRAAIETRLQRDDRMAALFANRGC
ncbi:MAG: hypothetical protein EOP84_12675 [Verrucomicrobiaceae bacterium]|nr:MAG: hypothetical protein EOP84_12675 [Verrucomicrobiaceae bacterium]